MRSALPSVKKYGDDVKVSMYEYSRPSWTELVYPIECYFPTWVIPKDHKVTSALEEAYHNLYGTERMGNAETEAMRKPVLLPTSGHSLPTVFPLWDVTESHASDLDLAQRHRLTLQTGKHGKMIW